MLNRSGLIRCSSLAVAGAISVSVLLLNAGHVQADSPITPSGLHTQVNLSSNPPVGQVQYDITGGTRPGGGENLFHSFGGFNVPPNNIANFLNGVSFDLNGTPLPAGLETSNILARVTGNIRSDIFGTIQTTGFDKANLFLMNPAGIVFGPGATLNVGGSVAFTTADYLRLTDGNSFNVAPNAATDALLSVESVAAFGFLTSSPGSIEVQQTQLFLNGQTISLVGGEIKIDGEGVSGGIAAPNGHIEIASVASRGEVVRTPQGLNVDAFAQLGTVSLTNNGTLDVTDLNGTGAGTIRIRGGRLLMDQSLIGADTAGQVDSSPVGINIGVRNDVVLQNFSVISSTTQRGLGRASDIAITASSVLVDNSSAISSSSSDGPGRAGNITLTVDQLAVTGGGEIKAGAFGPGQAGSISINGTESVTVSGNFGGDPTLPSLITSQSQSPTHDAGSISITTPSLAIMDGAKVESNSFSAGRGGDVVLSIDNLTMSGGAQIKTSSQPFFVSSEVPRGAGDIHVSATDTIALSGGDTGLFSETSGAGHGGDIALTAGQSVTISDGASVSASSTGPGNAGNISVNAGQQFEMRDSSITTQATKATGGNINIQAIDRVRLVNSTISTSVRSGPGSGGNITIDPNVVVLQNSPITAQADRGAGGNIKITTPLFLADSTSPVSASSQFGRNGTVTIQSPTSNLSESLGTLPSEPSQAQSLVTQRCAALANGQTSSFVVAGREQLPADPGGWLTSPLTFTALGESLDAGHAIASTPAVMAMATDDTGTVSIRRFTPAGFLMANFADSAATGCSS